MKGHDVDFAKRTCYWGLVAAPLRELKALPDCLPGNFGYDAADQQNELAY